MEDNSKLDSIRSGVEALQELLKSLLILKKIMKDHQMNKNY